jgi:hypothetical protein
MHRLQRLIFRGTERHYRNSRCYPLETQFFSVSTCSRENVMGSKSSNHPGRRCCLLLIVSVSERKLHDTNGRLTPHCGDRGLFNVNMPLLYGEEEKAFQRLQEEILKSTPDLTILAWESPRSSSESQNRIYCGVLAANPSYFAWCRKTHLLTRPLRKEFSMSNNRITIHWTMVGCTRSTRQGWVYTLPIHYEDLEMSSLRLGVALRKVGDDQFLRSNPHKLYDMTPDLHCYIYPGTHQLLIRPPSAQSSLPHSLPTLNLITEEYLSRLRPKSMRILLGRHIYREGIFPMSRFDHEDQIFFVSDETDAQDDWGIFHFSVRPDLSKWNLNSPPIYCVLYATSWGSLSAVQCSIIPYQPHSHRVNEIRSRVSQWDHSTQDVLKHLLGFNIPCTNSAVAEIPGTAFTAVVSLEIRIREDVPSWTPRGHARDAYISCSVHKSDSTPPIHDNSQWKI